MILKRVPLASSLLRWGIETRVRGYTVMRNFHKFLLGATAGAVMLAAPQAHATVINFDFQLSDIPAQQHVLGTPAGSIEITQIAPNQVGFLLKNLIDSPYDGNTFETKL